MLSPPIFFTEQPRSHQSPPPPSNVATLKNNTNQLMCETKWRMLFLPTINIYPRAALGGRRRGGGGRAAEKLPPPKWLHPIRPNVVLILSIYQDEKSGENSGGNDRIRMQIEAVAHGGGGRDWLLVCVHVCVCVCACVCVCVCVCVRTYITRTTNHCDKYVRKNWLSLYSPSLL